MVIVGYGDIGSRVARMFKRAFGAKVIGVNKFPDIVTKEQAQWADEIVGLDQYDRCLTEADYVVGLLPKMTSTDNFFDFKGCFSKMKKSAIFINLGRGTTLNEDDLANSLKNGDIGGCVCDVFRVEPLPKKSMLWDAPNMFMTPHCADQDKEWLFRSMYIFEDNLKKWVGGQKLNNLVDKEFAYRGSRPKL